MALGGGGLVSGGSGGGLGGLIYGNPQYNSAPVDAGTESLIEGQAAKGGSADTYAKNDLAGTNANADLTHSQNMANALGGPSDENMHAALQSRAQRSMDSGLNQLQRQAQVAGTGQYANQLAGAFGGASQLQKQMSDASAAQVQAHQNNQANRSAIIGSLFGGMGSMAGMMKPQSSGDQSMMNDFSDPSMGGSEESMME